MPRALKPVNPMTLTSRKRRPIARQEREYRDDRLFFVACDDTFAPLQYFGAIKFRGLHIVVLPAENNRSAPKHALERLDKARKEFQLQEDDEFWLVLDLDHQCEPNHLASLVDALSKALQKDMRLAVSNPCFELWLWLHHHDDFSGLPSPCTAGDLEKALKEALNGYNKTRLRLEDFTRGRAEQAAGRAKLLDTSTATDRWPRETGTHVYRLIEALLAAER